MLSLILIDQIGRIIRYAGGSIRIVPESDPGCSCSSILLYLDILDLKALIGLVNYVLHIFVDSILRCLVQIFLINIHRRIESISEKIRLHQLHSITFHEFLSGVLGGLLHIVGDHGIQEAFYSLRNRLLIRVTAGCQNHYCKNSHKYCYQFLAHFHPPIQNFPSLFLE